jgi:hypothetical protein
LVLLLLTSSCRDDAPLETYHVRAEVVRIEYGGLALRVDHEPIPGVMEAMRMSLRLQSPEDARELKPGDKIRFTYVVKEEGTYIRDIERLPSGTELNLEGIEVHDDVESQD